KRPRARSAIVSSRESREGEQEDQEDREAGERGAAAGPEREGLPLARRGPDGGPAPLRCSLLARRTFHHADDPARAAPTTPPAQRRRPRPRSADDPARAAPTT